MAFIKQSKPENRKGTLFVVAVDDDNGEEIKLGIRAIPESVERDIDSRYGRERDAESSWVEKADNGTERSGTALFRQRVQSVEEIRCSRRDRASWAWTSCENFEVLAQDEPMAAHYARLIGREVEIDKPFKLDTCLTEKVKAYILDNDSVLVAFILGKAAELGKREYGKEKALAKNS